MAVTLETSVWKAPPHHNPTRARGHEQAGCRQTVAFLTYWIRRFVPSIWSLAKCSAELKVKQVSPPSRQISLRTHSLCPMGAEQTTANSALLPGLQPQAGAQTSSVPSFLPLGSCEGVRHAPPSPGPGQSPGTADHPQPTKSIPSSRGSKDLRR